MKIKKSIAMLLAMASMGVCMFSACDFGMLNGSESTVSMVEEKKIQCKTYNGEAIDCTPSVYQKYLSLTEEKDIAQFLME